jgi:hypothetical protein
MVSYAMRTFVEQYAAKFDPRLLSILENAFADAWHRVQASHAPYGTEEYAPVARRILAEHIIEQAQAGERDPLWLAESALLYLSRQKLGLMHPKTFYDPEYWRKRAEEALTFADQMDDLHTKGIMVGIATSYEKIATWVEGRQ